LNKEFEVIPYGGERLVNAQNEEFDAKSYITAQPKASSIRGCEVPCGKIMIIEGFFDGLWR